ncbi:MAG TPA: phosphatidate cytidylyltransferase [Longilinea sp.]|nr:phosphatidate cytidylyltransferase [Longilinea sp.]
MLLERLISLLILIPLAIGAVYLGGWFFAAFVLIAMLMSAWEFSRLFKSGGYRPAEILLLITVGVTIVIRYLFGVSGSTIVLSVGFLAAMAWHTVDQQRGAEKSASDLAITVCGMVYLGWLGAYAVSLRELPGGLWWSLLVIPAISLADGAAYFVGRAFGRHKMMSKVSPKKSWEGYIGGVIIASLLSAGFGYLWNAMTPDITPLRGLIVGLVVSMIAPLGDFGESMIKREFGVKDSSHLIPGHGGFLDRIDSTIWAIVIGYFLITLFW